MSDLKTRKATPNDIRDIQQLYRQLDLHHSKLLPEVFQALNGDARADDLIRNWIDRNDADYLMAEMEGHVVGFLNLEKTSHPVYPMFKPRQYAMIENVVVDTRYRGRGIGRALFDAARTWAMEHGVLYLQTSVWYSNESAREWYLGQGFRPMTIRLELNLEK